jgi:histone acetyltransferase HTATIP
MAVREPHDEATGTPDPVEKGFATLNTLRYVVKIADFMFSGI